MKKNLGQNTMNDAIKSQLDSKNVEFSEEFSSKITRLCKFGKCYKLQKRHNLQNIISGSIIEILSYHDV